ncbi:MAG: DUF1549 domain-containing protein [Polyangiaceae bacterium]
MMRSTVNSGVGSRLRGLVGATLVLFAAACSQSPSGDPPVDTTPVAPAPTASTQAAGAVEQAAAEQAKKQLDQRKVDYGEALRSAALKLVGDLPTLAEIKAIEANGKVAYEKAVDAYLADPRFAARMVRFFRDTFKTGGDGKFDGAALFAASVVVQDRPYTDLFTATTGTCPTFDAATGTFTPGDCANTPSVGVLNDAGLMQQYYSNMAFRRVRFVQETFACAKFPAEISSAPVQMGAGAYTSPWKFDSITGGAAAKINFQDTTSVVCANCHTTLNHQAPLFAFFDEQGKFTPGSIQVKVPVSGSPTAALTDWLPEGQQQFFWRNGGAPVSDLAGLGREMAKDPTVQACAVNRVWNWGLSRGDIVGDLATIPDVVTKDLVTDFAANGFKLKRVIRNVFTADDFVKY